LYFHSNFAHQYETRRALHTFKRRDLIWPFDAMMEMTKIDIAAIEAAHRGK
jgi:hypothetical protein